VVPKIRQDISSSSSFARSVEMKIAGHKTESVYRRDAIVSDADLQEAARKLAGTIPGTATVRGVDAEPITAR
jgi:hypothetical protein